MSLLSLYLIDPELVDYGRARGVLTPAECDRADRFVFDADRREWTCFRASAKRILGHHLGIPPHRVAWLTTDAGKPFVDDPKLEFNLTHSGGMAALLISTVGSVGVDLEPSQRGHDLLECAASFCHPDEIHTLAQDSETRAIELIRLWTAKEALLKGHGSGLAFPPTELIIENGQGLAELAGLERFHLIRPSVPRLAGYCFAAAVPLCVDRIKVVEFDHEADLCR
jgi:phosphopantetheinyl transferase